MKVLKVWRKIQSSQEKFYIFASQEFLNRRKLEVFEIKNEEYLCLKWESNHKRKELELRNTYKGKEIKGQITAFSQGF